MLTRLVNGAYLNLNLVTAIIPAFAAKRDDGTEYDHPIRNRVIIHFSNSENPIVVEHPNPVQYADQLGKLANLSQGNDAFLINLIPVLNNSHTFNKDTFKFRKFENFDHFKNFR